MSKILVVEDNQDNMDLVCFLLRNAGHEVLEALDGIKGLKIVEEDRPDLILLDLAIPEIDGWQIAETLKSNPDTDAIPVIAFTAHTLPGDRRRALEAGCNGFISKPISVETFIGQVEEHLPTA